MPGKLGRIHSNFEFSNLENEIRNSNLFEFKHLIKFDQIRPSNFEKKGPNQIFIGLFIAQNVQLWSKIDILNFFAENLSKLNLDIQLLGPIKSNSEFEFELGE